ncbi:MAG: hypothetical protein KAR16_07735 [Bacteroidales bacterium]|nr:hypothetical protein [Bacteroidales bacterium]
MRSWRWVLPALFGLLLSDMQIIAGTTRVEPSMEHEHIVKILNAAQAGDTVLFAEGTYSGAYRLENLHGGVNLPVVIRGVTSEQSIIDGDTKPGMGLQHQAFTLEGCSWIVIEQFTIKNCWTDLVQAENTSYLSLRLCDLYGGKRALFAKGRDSHHFLVEQCNWQQDERVWTHADGYSWDEVHHGIHKHYNGSLFQGSEISGGFVLRDNQIRNTFNAFRLSQINDGASDPLACTNGEIYRNTIHNTSDNVLEPEVHALNLHFYHNTMVNGHAFVSITEVQGGEIYIYGNTAISMPDSEDGWTIFKISSGRDSLNRPLYIFNNSWQVDFDMIGSPRNVWENSHIRHFNNACVSVASDSFGIYNIGDDNRFDYDCSNVPFPALLTSKGFEKKGMVADPMFRDPLAGDFILQKESPCIDKGKKAKNLILDYHGKRPDIGAYDNGALIQGLPFRYRVPDAKVPYRELPRITRMHMEDDKLSIWFSLPMDGFSLKLTDKWLKHGNQLYPLEYKALSDDLYCLTLKGKDLPAADSFGLSTMELKLSQWPKDLQGRRLSSWASEIQVSLYKDLVDEKRNP